MSFQDFGPQIWVGIKRFFFKVDILYGEKSVYINIWDEERQPK